MFVLMSITQHIHGESSIREKFDRERHLPTRFDVQNEFHLPCLPYLNRLKSRRARLQYEEIRKAQFLIKNVSYLHNKY